MLEPDASQHRRGKGIEKEPASWRAEKAKARYELVEKPVERVIEAQCEEEPCTPKQDKRQGGFGFV
jgi:hypothetical protein